MISMLIVAIMLCASTAFATGAPDYLPDGPHPRITLNAAELTRLAAKRDANTTEWSTLVSWCDSHISDAGYNTQPTDIGYGGNIAYGLANWSGDNQYNDYRMSGFATHLYNYSLAYQVLKQSGSAQDLTKANSYATRAAALLMAIANNLNVGEEPNGLRAIRVSDLSDTSINSSEVTALKATTESLPGQVSNISYKLGYSSRFLSAVPVAYDWIYDTLSQSDKDVLAPMMLRWYDWIQGTRSTYNNGVLINGIRYYEDNGGVADDTHINANSGAITTASDFGKTYSNFGNGHEALMTLIPVALYGYNADIPAYLNQTKSRLSTAISSLESNLDQAGGESIEGWNYGSGFAYLLPALYGYYTATGDTAISNMTWPSKLVEAMVHRLGGNLLDVPYYGYWTGTPMGVNRASFAWPFIGVQQRLHIDSDLSKIGQYLKNNVSWANSPTLYDNMLWSRSDVSEIAPSALTLSHLATGNGFFTSRSSWVDPNSIHLITILKGVGARANHEGYSQGHFSLSRGTDRLLSHSNSAGDSPPSVSFNTVIFNGSSHHANNPTLTSPAIDRTEEGTEYSYVSGDITNAWKRQYNADRALLFRRSVLHVRPGFVVIYDVTRSNSALGNLKDWYTQYTASPTTTSDTISATVGSSNVFVKTLFPTGGTFTTSNPYTGSYRVKYTPATSQEYEQFLHVIEATDSAASQTSATAIEGTGGRGVVIGGNTVAMFTSDQAGANITSLSYSADTTAASTHYIADLTPGATYNVSIDGGAATQYTASDAGLIVFTNPNHSPHSYSIVLDGQAVTPGSCGSSNGLALSSAPTVNLCTAGTASAVSGTGPWSWSCAGSGGGSTASCSATLLDVPSVGTSAAVACSAIAGFR